MGTKVGIIIIIVMLTLIGMALKVQNKTEVKERQEFEKMYTQCLRYEHEYKCYAMFK